MTLQSAWRAISSSLVSRSIDVRIKRVDFAAGITDSVYRRMESERKRVANELRATGSAEAEKIQAPMPIASVR